MRTLTYAEWRAEGIKRFGVDHKKWRFVCPSCGHIASVADWEAAGAPPGAVAFSCIGRWTGSDKEIGDKSGGPCNYAGGGFFGLNPVCIIYDDGEKQRAFEFADAVVGI